MALKILGVDPDTHSGDCPTAYLETATGDYILKGWKVDEATLAEAGPDPRETVIRVPARMVQFLGKE